MVFKKNKVKYKVPYTDQAYELFKKNVMQETPDEALKIVKSIFRLKNNDEVHPQWALRIADDGDIGLYISIMESSEAIVMMLNQVIAKEKRD